MTHFHQSFYFIFWLCHMAYRILVPWPGIKPISPALKGRFLTTFLPGKSLNNLLLPLYTLSILKFPKLFHTIYIYIYMYMYMCIYIYTHTSEKAMVPYSSTLAWKIPWTEEPGGLQYMGSLRVGHEWATSLSLSCIGEGNGNPLVFLPGESQGRGCLVDCHLWGRTESDTAAEADGNL